MLSIKGYNHPKLQIDNWSLNSGEACVILGQNGSGKQFFDQLITGELSKPKEVIQLVKPDLKDIALISHESIRCVYEHELKIDQTDITDEIDFGTPVKDFLPADKLNSPLIDNFNLRHKMDTGFRLLSSGEGRKLFIVKAILEQKRLIILDNPFDELDIQSRLELGNQLKKLSSLGVTVIVMLNNPIDSPSWVEHFALLQAGQLTSLAHLSIEQRQEKISEVFSIKHVDHALLTKQIAAQEQSQLDLIKIQKATVTFNGQKIFSDFDLTVKSGQHTIIVGPNGCGKSTLMGLITGDNPQCFSNDVTIVGYRRGSGETVWDVKKHLGIVSPELHRNYRVNCSALTVVASGFKDSIGLYQTISGLQKQIAIDWLKLLGLFHKANESLRSLSYGQQRLVLIARALVKQPKLLVLDEPTQGLDQLNRNLVLEYLEKIVQLNASTIVMVSHRIDEQKPFFQQVVDFNKLLT